MPLLLLTESDYLDRARGLSKKRLSDALKNGRIRGATRNERGEWQIPENALMDYYPGFLAKEPNFTKVMIHILRALNQNRYVDSCILGCTEPFFQDAIGALLEAGLISRSDAPADGITSIGYRLTEEGRSSELINTRTKLQRAFELLSALMPDIKIN